MSVEQYFASTAASAFGKFFRFLRPPLIEHLVAPRICRQFSNQVIVLCVQHDTTAAGSAGSRSSVSTCPTATPPSPRNGRRGSTTICRPCMTNLRERRPIPLRRRRLARQWQSEMAAGVWAAITWPQEFGGRAATARQQLVYYLISAERRVPPLAGRIGLNLCGPTLIAHGTPEQQQRFLPPMLDGREVWCQGFSEPGRGIRPCLAAHPWCHRRRRPGDHRPEDLDLRGAARRLDVRVGAHRPRRAQARGNQLRPGSDDTPTVSTCGRSARCRATPNSTRSSSTRSGSRLTTWSAAQSRAGASPGRRWPTSGRSCSWASRWP